MKGNATMWAVVLACAGAFALEAAELPQSFRTTKPKAVFSARPERYGYRPFSEGTFDWRSSSASCPLPTGCPEFTIDRPRPHGGKVVKATDFGFSPTHSNNAACVTRAIAYAKEIGADRVELAPGVYRCHDKAGVVVSGTKDLLIDGKGACLVFYRPSVARDVTYWEVEISTDYGSFRLLDNERLEIRDLNVDWDWVIDPLAERVRLVDVHLDDRPDESYWEFDFIDYDRHPVYPRHLPVQTIADLSDELVDGWRVRFAEKGSCRYFSTHEGSHGMKVEWVSPNRARCYPRVRPTAYGTHIHPDYDRFIHDGGPGANRNTVENHYRMEKGRLYRLSHYYVGKNCFDMLSNHHLTLENVNVYSCRGDAFHIEGSQHHWQLVNVAVWPPEDPSKAGGGPRIRPMTTTLDVMHIGCSKGWSKLIGFRCTMNQDDHANFHDRFSALRKTGPCEARITQGRGNAYFRAEVGDELDFRNQDMTPAGFSARITAVVNDEYLRFDRDLPERLTVEDAFVFNRARGTDNIYVKDCHYDSCWGRFLMLGHNVTFENCLWENGIASAVLVQEGLNYGYWAEGFGAGNVVIRNCRFKALQKFNRASFAGVVQDLFVGANLMDDYRELNKAPAPSILSGVLVEGCTFVNPRGAVWHVRNGENLVFRNNTIDLTEDDPNGQPYRGSVFVEGTTRDVVVSGNRLVGKGEAGLVHELPEPTNATDVATLFFAGDSTLDDAGYSLGGKIRPPYYSWGTQLQKSMRTGCRVANYAESGASTKSFVTSGLWAKLIARVKQGDFVAIQFGHNDQKRSTDFYLKHRFAHPQGLFREIVRAWVADVRKKGATPILLSPICRATFGSDGKMLVDMDHSSEGVCLNSYCVAMRELADELKCDFVDMNGMTRELLSRVGRDEAYKFYVISTGLVKGKDGEPSKDTTHPIQSGAAAFAKLFLDDVMARRLSVAKLFKDADFPITDFGAKADGTKCTESFARAMAACERAGGGRVTVPRGTWFSGAIRFRSNCELHLAEGAEVVFSQDPNDYLPAVHTSWEGMECWNYCPLVYAYCCTNVAITGSGTLRGYAGEWKDSAWYPWVPQANGIKAARLQLYTWGATDYPVEKREIYKMKDAHTRPQLVQFNRCKGVTWDGFKVRNAPFWTLHLYMCEDAAVRNLDVCAHGNNNDGIDIEMSRHVTLEKCRFDQGDDGIVIKSGRNRDAWRLNAPTQDVFIRDCEIVDAHTLLGIGSEISGGVKNLRLVNCVGRDVNRGVFIKTNRRRGGTLENISVDGVRVGNVRAELVGLSTDTLYEWADFPDYENRTTVIRNVDIRNVHGGKAKRRVDLVGDARLPVENMRLENVTVDSAKEPDVVENVRLADR